jgi:hypothetical protein
MKIQKLSEFHVNEVVKEVEFIDEEYTESNQCRNAHIIKKAEEWVTNRIDAYFQKKPELPSDVDDETRKHVSDLKLPIGIGDERSPATAPILHNCTITITGP